MYNFQTLAADKYGNLSLNGMLQKVISYQAKINWQDTSELKIVCEQNADNLQFAAPFGGIVGHDGCVWGTTGIECNGSEMTIHCGDALEQYRNLVYRGTLQANNTLQAVNQLLTAGTSPPGKILPPTGELPPLSAPIETSWATITDALIKLGASTGFGFMPVADVPNVTSRIYAGVDRTTGKYRTGYFSDVMNNIDAHKIVDIIKNYRNFAIVAGEGEGTARIWTTVGIDDWNIRRRELFVDARDLQKKYTIVGADGETTEGEYTNAQYIQMLQARGLDALAVNRRERYVSADIIEIDGMRYDEDYLLGDIVPLYLRQYGVWLSARVASVYVVIENGSISVRPTLSNFTIQGGDNAWAPLFR